MSTHQMMRRKQILPSGFLVEDEDENEDDESDDDNF